jgi:hypothetical protein
MGLVESVLRAEQSIRQGEIMACRRREIGIEGEMKDMIVVGVYEEVEAGSSGYAEREKSGDSCWEEGFNCSAADLINYLRVAAEHRYIQLPTQNLLRCRRQLWFVGFTRQSGSHAGLLIDPH